MDKHHEICIKTGQKKRKTFDMTKKRVEGTEAAAFVKKNGKKGAAAKKVRYIGGKI